jgi:hypothetical protein
MIILVSFNLFISDNFFFHPFVGGGGLHKVLARRLIMYKNLNDLPGHNYFEFFLINVV